MSRSVFLALCAIGLWAVSAQAAVSSFVDEPLGDSGWRVMGPGHYDLEISVDGEGVTDDIKWVAISVSKNFRAGPDPFTGLYPAIELDFMQMDGVEVDDLATRIIIQSELINNSTGTDWADYHWRLYGHDIARFNRDMTNPTTDFNENGWLIDPFSEYAWDYDEAFDIDQLSVWNGVIVDGGAFFPGTGSGNLVIDVDLSDPDRPDPAIFKFSQNPTPEPGTMVLLGLGAIGLLRRRRA